MFTPLLSEPDPLESAEGSIDPLGMYAIADALGTRLVPGVRERQSRPRFLTISAVSLHVCSVLPEETVAKDGTSEPWLVFEWYVVDGLTRSHDDDGDQGSLPGRLKAAAALKDGVRLCASRYLKTPSVFGFHGVYRVLARRLGIDDGGRLGETGYEMVRTWAGEQGLEGFIGSGGGPGERWRRALQDAVQDGLRTGAVARSASWEGWSFIARHLAHHRPGVREAEVLKRALMDVTDGYRHAVLGFLVSQEGRRVLESQGNVISERDFHAALRAHAGEPLRDLLHVIGRYEAFARLLQDAFDDALYEMSRARQRVQAAELAGLASHRDAADRVPRLFEELCELLQPYGEAIRFQETFADVSWRCPPAEWAENLLEHHRRVQRSKPPHGKAPWFERFDDGSYVIRPAYMRQAGGRGNGEYVHAYRTNSLRSFARDLRMLD